MAQQGSHGSNATAYCNGRAVQTYFRRITLSRSGEAPEDTTIGLDTRTREEDGLMDGSIGGDGKFRDQAGNSDTILRALLGAATTVWTIYPGGETAVGDDGLAGVCIENEYSSEMPYDDIVTFSMSAESDNYGDAKNTGLERVLCLHPLASRTTTGNGSTLDLGASSTAGGSVYLQVGDTSGTTPTLDVIVTHSANSDMSSSATLATFTQVSSDYAAQRVAFTGTCNRYVRVEYTIGGSDTPTFPFTAAICRHVA